MYIWAALRTPPIGQSIAIITGISLSFHARFQRLLACFGLRPRVAPQIETWGGGGVIHFWLSLFMEQETSPRVRALCFQETGFV